MRGGQTGRMLDYVAQPDRQTCQSACVAQVLGLGSYQDVLKVRRDLEAMGVPGDPFVMGAYLKERVQEYIYLPDAALKDFDAALSQGYRLITHGCFTESGHVIGVQSIADDASLSGGGGYVVDDPWYEYSFVAGAYDTSKGGNDVIYSRLGIYSYCVAAWSHAEAAQVYAQGRVFEARKGAYLHLVRN